MRRVAGSLRLDLAQYREVAAFAQFSSELDKSIQDQLARGERMVQLLKQPQYAPVAVEDQVVLIFAGTFGYLDDVPVSDIPKFESEYLPFIRERYPEIPRRIRETKDLSQETQEALKKALGEFKANFFRPASGNANA